MATYCLVGVLGRGGCSDLTIQCLEEVGSATPHLGPGSGRDVGRASCRLVFRLVHASTRMDQVFPCHRCLIPGTVGRVAHPVARAGLHRLRDRLRTTSAHQDGVEATPLRTTCTADA